MHGMEDAECIKMIKMYNCVCHVAYVGHDYHICNLKSSFFKFTAAYFSVFYELEIIIETKFE